MKYFCLFCLLFFSLCAVAQSGPAPFKGANAVALNTSDSAAVAFVKVAQALIDAGYSLDKTDKELGFISTKPRPAPRYNMMYSCALSIRATPAGSTVTTSGAFSLPGAAAVSPIMAGESPIEYRGGENGTFMVCWRAMQQAAQTAYPAAAPVYIRR